MGHDIPDWAMMNFQNYECFLIPVHLFTMLQNSRKMEGPFSSFSTTLPPEHSSFLLMADWIQRKREYLGSFSDDWMSTSAMFRVSEK